MGHLKKQTAETQRTQWFRDYQRKIFTFSLVLLITVGFTAVSCTPSPAPPPALPTESSPTLLKIGVSSSAAAILPLINEAYSQTAPVAIQFIVANNASLFADLDNNFLDAILVHHIPPQNGRYFNPVALDGLVIITHPSNRVNNLTTAEVQAIFSGSITNWQAVGGLDMPITLFSREPEAGIHTLLRQQMMAGQPISPNALLQTGDEAMRTVVASNPAAIGSSSMSGVSQNGAVKMLTIDDRSASPTTTASQTYPFTTPLYFVSAQAQEPTGELRHFLAWLQSDTGQAVIGQIYGKVRASNAVSMGFSGEEPCAIIQSITGCRQLIAVSYPSGSKTANEAYSSPPAYIKSLTSTE